MAEEIINDLMWETSPEHNAEVAYEQIGEKEITTERIELLNKMAFYWIFNPIKRYKYIIRRHCLNENDHQETLPTEIEDMTEEDKMMVAIGRGYTLPGMTKKQVDAIKRIISPETLNRVYKTGENDPNPLHKGNQIKESLENLL